MKFKFLFLYKYIFLICFLHSFAYGEMLIIQGSDQHSSYQRLPQFLKSIGILSEQFKAKYPDGKLVLIINGDFSSYDRFWTAGDQGNFGYEILSQLASKYLVFYTFGNHDSFDWKDSQLFLNQMTMLKEAGVRLIVANAFFYPKYQNLFKPFVDIPLSKYHMIRFAGFTFPRFDRGGVSHFKSGVIANIAHIQEHLLSLIDKANNSSRVRSLILSMHVGSRMVQNIVSTLSSDRKEKLEVVFTAHDHKQFFDRSGPTHIINSGSHFNFSTVIIDDQGQVISTSFFDQNSQEEISGQMEKGSLEARLIQKAGGYMGRLVALGGDEAFRSRFFDNSDRNSLSQCARIVRELY